MQWVLKIVGFFFLFVHTPTFDCIGNVFAADVQSYQTARIVLRLPFVVDNALQFDFRAAVVMFARAAVYDYIVRSRFIRMKLIVAFEYSTIVRSKINIKIKPKSENMLKHDNAIKIGLIRYTAKQTDEKFYLHFFEGYVLGRTHRNLVH